MLLQNRLLVAFVTSLAVLLCASPADACILIGPLKLEGYPRDGAQDVPLDAIPIYQLTVGELLSGVATLPDGGLPNWYSPDGGSLLDKLPARQMPEVSLSHASGAVEVRIRRAQGGYFEIVPAERLLPQTQYTLSVRWKDAERPTSPSDPGSQVEREGQVRFRTGDAVFAGDTSAPLVSATQLVAKYTGSCDPLPRAVCFSLSDDEGLYEAQFEGDPLVSLERGSFFSNRPATDPGEQLDCLRVRRREPNGALSEPALSCRADRTVYDLDPLREREEGIFGLGCKSDGLYWGDERVSDRSARAAERARAQADGDEPDQEGATEQEDAPTEMRSTSDCSLAPGARSCAGGTVLLGLAGAFALRARSRRKR